MLGNEGMERDSNSSFCAPTASSMVFGRSDGDRVAVTRDLVLRPRYTLQFKVKTWKVNLATVQDHLTETNLFVQCC